MRPGRISQALWSLLLGCGAAAGPGPVDPARYWAGGRVGTVEVATDGAFSLPLPSLIGDAERQFFRGRALFRDQWVTAPASTQTRDGLGPVFNARACFACHQKDGRGRGPEDGADFVEGVVRLSMTMPSGEIQPEPNYGGQLQPSGIYGVPGEGRPKVYYRTIEGAYGDGQPYSLRQPELVVEALALGPLSETVLTSARVAPMMIGLGLLEAIPEAEILAVADPDDLDGDGISGRANRVDDVSGGALALGRFGWKSNQPTVTQQTAGAFGGDLGLTTRLFPLGPCGPTDEACLAAPSGGDPEVLDTILEDVAFYSMALGVPAPRDLDDPEVGAGERVFKEMGCESCHRSGWTLGASELAQVEGETIWPYTDLLLHDLGEGLADRRPDFEANGQEWRTAPLWGLGLLGQVNGHQTLLHDGRARSFAEAILWHGGEGEAAKERFRSADAATRAALLHFLESL